MAEYHVGCGLAGIYARILKKNGIEWLHKSDVTREALSAVAQYLFFSEKEFRFERGGYWYRLSLEEMEDG